MTTPKCYDPTALGSLGAAKADQARFENWARTSRQAAKKLSVAETGLLSARSIATQQVTLQGPGASQVRTGAQDALNLVCQVGQGLGDAEHALNQIADHYEDLAAEAAQQVKQIAAYQAKHAKPQVEAKPWP